VAGRYLTIRDSSARRTAASGCARSPTPNRPDVDATLVGVFNDHAQYAAIPAADRARLRYVLVSHDNDGVGVTKFGADLSHPASARSSSTIVARPSKTMTAATT